MIVTLSLNPCIDRTICVDKFLYGGMNRSVSTRDDACGKAVNLALVASSLGAEAKCVGLLPVEDGQKIAARLEKAGVLTQFLAVPGRLRVNIKLFDESQNVITEINERGSPAPDGTVDALWALLEREIHEGDWLVLTGSMPGGFGTDYYAQLAQRLGKRCRCVLDAEGEPLLAGISARPAMIKPNRAELEKLLSRKLHAFDEVLDAARKLHDDGIERVVVSLGEEGALMVDDEGALFAPALKVCVRSTVGAGDSMIAGMLTGFARGCGREEAFSMGVAAAASSVASEGTQLVDAQVYCRMAEKTIVRRL